MFSIGKHQALKTLASDYFKQKADVFAKAESAHEEQDEVGERASVSL